MSEKNNNRENVEFLLDKWNAELEELKIRLKKADIDTKTDYDGPITALRRFGNKAKK